MSPVDAIILSASVVDTKALLDSTVAALVSGLAVTVAFSIAIYGVVRCSDLRGEHRPLAAAAAAAVAVVAGLASLAGMALGITVMIS